MHGLPLKAVWLNGRFSSTAVAIMARMGNYIQHKIMGVIT